MIFPFIRDKANPLHVHSHAGDSNDKIVSMMVRGGAAIAASFHITDSCDNHHDDVNILDNNDNSLQLSNRKRHGGVLFQSTRHQFNYGQAKKAIYDNYLWPDSLYGSEFRIIFWVSQPWFQDMMTKIMNTPGLEFYQDLL